MRAPTRGQPLVKEFVELCDQQGYTLGEVARRVGTPTNVLYRWNIGATPTLYLFEAALNAIGYKLEITPK